MESRFSMPDTPPPPEPHSAAAAGDARLMTQNRDLDAEVSAAWRRNDELEYECVMWRERAEKARDTIRQMEKSFSWLLTTPLRKLDRMQRRYRRSIRKRMAKLANFVRRLMGKPQVPLPSNEPLRPTTDSLYRHSLKRAAETRATDFLQGPPIAARSESGADVAVYYSTSGNYFFQEIALLLHAGITQAGFRAELRTDEHGAAADAGFHLVVAPHEFFPLGRGASCFGKNAGDRLLLLNTEQPQTQWYRLAAAMFPHARHIFDMDRETAAANHAAGLPASHLPLGFVENFAPYSTDRDLQPGPETEALGMDVRRWRDTGRLLTERPIALSFVGGETARRSAFFAKASPLLEQHECHLRLMPGGSGPWTAGRTRIHLRTLTTVGLSQRSRIVFNVHRDKEHYFEWHRIVLMGIWQRALVLTETATETAPFVPGEDYVQAPLEEMPHLIDYYLRDPQGIAAAERIRNSGYERLRSQCNLPSMMREILTPLLTAAR